MSNAKTTSEVRVIPSNQPTASPILIHPREPGLEYYIDHRGVRYPSPPPPPFLLSQLPWIPLSSLCLFDSFSSIYVLLFVHVWLM
jgi:oligopeptidase B